jgi:signal transduction histidine kinase
VTKDLFLRHPTLRRAAVHVTIAVAVCAALALRSAMAGVAARSLHPNFRLTDPDLRMAWAVAWYAMWLVLTPLVFLLARRVRIRRERWVLPLAFHAVMSVVVTVVGGLALDVLFGGLVLGHGWPDGLGDFLSPFWTQMALVYALGETSLYWILLACGTLFLTYDEYHARRLQAADLQRSLAAAQADALKMKLQPHFLFNTLNSISFMALERDTSAVVTMVDRLGRLLRASMQPDGGRLIPLAEELALADEYLAIEEVRFKDRLKVVRRIEPDALRARVPALLLQPIIENSIKHGFSRRLDASVIEIAIAREGAELVVLVTDDGPGLPEGWSAGTGFGRGLRNVAERLEVLYRGRWLLAVRNAAPRGTVAELRIPWSAA